MISRNDIHGKTAPEWAQAVCDRFGMNPYGEPRFRIVWGPARRCVAGGLWEKDGNVIAYKLAPKYGKVPKWVLERWRPPSAFGTPELWISQTMTPDGSLALGPFPVYGQYEFAAEFTVGIDEYVPLEPMLIERVILKTLENSLLSEDAIRSRDKRDREQAEQRHDAEFDAMWDERQHAFKGGLTIGAHAKYNHQEEIDAYVRKLEKHRAWVPAQGFRPGFAQTGDE